MGVHRTRLYILAALCASFSTAAPVSDNLAVSVLSPLTARISSTATLPCWLNPPQNVEGLEVRWYRGDNFDSPALLYKAGVLDTSEDAKYRGRVSFGQKSSSSGGLKTGDVSLQLVNVTVEDAGDYTCYISSDRGYDKGSIGLSVIETGTSPLLTVGWTEGNEVNVSCESKGWYPQPHLRWSDQTKDLKPNHLTYNKSSSGLVSVHSWLLAPSSSEVFCSVTPDDGVAEVARVRLGKPLQSKGSGSSVGGWVAFALLLVSIFAVVGLLYYKRALFFGKKDESQNEVDGKDLRQPLLKDVPTGFTEAGEHYVNVTLDNQENPHITIKDSIVRDKIDGSSVTCLTAVRGLPGFSSGQHYWEVNLHKDAIGSKLSWWLGVTTATDFHKHPDIPPKMSNGFWFLSSSPSKPEQRAESLQLNTVPKVLLPVLPRPRRVGVYLNYDGGELSFYNVEAKSLIGSLNVNFSGEEVFPLFNPGIGDRTPMEIIQKPEE